MIERGKTTGLREQFLNSANGATCTERDDRILQLLETFEDELIAQKERNDSLEYVVSQLEHIIAILQEQIADFTDRFEREQAKENERLNEDPDEYRKQLDKLLEDLDIEKMRDDFAALFQPHHHPTE